MTAFRGKPFVVLSTTGQTKWQALPTSLAGRLINRHPMTIVGVAASGFHGLTFARFPPSGSPRRCPRKRGPALTDCSIAGSVGCRFSAGCGLGARDPWPRRPAALVQSDARRGFQACRIPPTSPRSAGISASTLSWTPLRRVIPPCDAGSRNRSGPLCGNGSPADSGMPERRGPFPGARIGPGAEITTRLALGASRGRIALLADSILLALAGGSLGACWRRSRWKHSSLFCRATSPQSPCNRPSTSACRCLPSSSASPLVCSPASLPRFRRAR